MDATILNLRQQPDELDGKVHGEDYYWYLRSPEFIKAFIEPLGDIVDGFGSRVLDVGCGEGYLAEHVMVSYLGFDGSQVAIDKAIKERSAPGRAFGVGRLEAPDFTLGQFKTIVFGGLFSVLVKPERQIEFVRAYCDGYGAKQFIVYDLERLKMDRFDAAFGERLSDYHADAGLKDKKPVYNLRQIIAYKYTEFKHAKNAS